MVTDFRTIPVHATLNQAVELLLSGEQREFPVLDNHGRTEGILTRDNLIRGFSPEGRAATVAEAMTPGVPGGRPDARVPGCAGPAAGQPAAGAAGGGREGEPGRATHLDNITDLLLVRRAGRRSGGRQRELSPLASFLTARSERLAEFGQRPHFGGPLHIHSQEDSCH